jgi:hypothetical protein
MNDYINGILWETIARANALKTKIPGASELNVYFEALSTKADAEIDEVISNLNSILNDERLNQPQTLKQKIVFLKQINRNLSILETVVVNKLVSEICKEIKYPLAKPVVSCLSQDYYHIYTNYNLLCVPLLESDFLQHIPDLYHELAHPLISIDNPKVKLFREELGSFNSMVIQYFETEIEKESKNSNRLDFINSIYIWQESWVENWATEFFCDLFGVYTVGPAFAWSHLHLTVKTCSNVYDYSDTDIDSHPPDDARMKTMIHGLNLIGYKEESKLIEAKWNDFVTAVEHERKRKGRYDYAVPDFFLEAVAVKALQGTKSIGCKISSPNHKDSPINKLLNDTWNIFWSNMKEFPNWEENEVKKLRIKLGV